MSKVIKQIKLILFFVLGFLIQNSNANNYFKNDFGEIHHEIRTISDSNFSKSDVVYVCSGDYAKKYHSRSNCTGLNNCQGELYYMDSYTAINKYRREACCVCYNCAGSGGGGGGGGGNDNGAIGYVALAVVVTSAAILSNDLYIYPLLSFKQPNNKNIRTSSTGWAFGFRKTFKHCALEYGASNFKSSSQYYDWNGNYDTYSNVNSIWGVHLNFVHEIFYNKTADWLKLYTGPTINSIQYADFGYGVILGAEMKIKGRLKFDARYELSTQTNQIRAGLIYKYQKKYLWQR